MTLIQIILQQEEHVLAVDEDKLCWTELNLRFTKTAHKIYGYNVLSLPQTCNDVFSSAINNYMCFIMILDFKWHNYKLKSSTTTNRSWACN